MLKEQQDRMNTNILQEFDKYSNGRRLTRVYIFPTSGDQSPSKKHAGSNRIEEEEEEENQKEEKINHKSWAEEEQNLKLGCEIPSQYELKQRKE